MNLNILTIFPNFFTSPFGETIIKRAQEKGLISINIHDLRKWTTDKHQSVDDTPYGGGAGMVMKVEPFYRALKDLGIQKESNNKKIVLLSPRGKTLDQTIARDYSSLDEITFLCGRYEGVDQRVSDYLIDEELSIGDYVLSGGEVAAITVVDAIVRLIPGVLGNQSSPKEESFSTSKTLEYPHYTKPDIFTSEEGEDWTVPRVLLSGNHAEVEKWRKEQLSVSN